MRAYILGVGRMGTAIAYAMDKFGFHVVGMDTNPDAAENIPQEANQENVFFIVDDAQDICRGIGTAGDPDIVISSLPYHQTEIVGKWCVDNGVRYCDLGGRVDVSQNINDHAKEKATRPIFTDLGLAPGWVNILAEHGCKKVHSQIDSVKMMVGGLPAIPKNPPFNYTVTWSTDGLINEYRDDCLVLDNGEIKTVAGMDGKETVYSKWLEQDLEAFFTSGGASHTIPDMQARGIKNCAYKTLRYEGHCDTVKLLIRNTDLNDESLANIFEKGCGKGEGDIVLIKAIVKSGDLTWDKEIIIGYDQKFSAMQKATAFSISSVAKMMAEGKFDDRKIQNRGGDISLPVVLKYSDICYEEFEKNLNELGL
tara:strand:- start:1716 stop:2813 length:1098 start_codon:yes stop_codon:yes gene_type:complete